MLYYVDTELFQNAQTAKTFRIFIPVQPELK